jgi:hypothetical protein
MCLTTQFGASGSELEQLLALSSFAKIGAHFLTRMYEYAEGDLVLGLICFEVATRCTGALYQGIRDNPDTEIASKIRSDAESRIEHFKATNCNSIASATGIPYATVHRKVRKLIELGWLREESNGHLYLTTLPAKHSKGLYQELKPLLAQACDSLRLSGVCKS